MATAPQIKEDIKVSIALMAQNQGSWSRLYNYCVSDNWNWFNKVCYENNFKDVVDFIMWIEG